MPKKSITTQNEVKLVFNKLMILISKGTFNNSKVMLLAFKMLRCFQINANFLFIKKRILKMYCGFHNNKKPLNCFQH